MILRENRKLGLWVASVPVKGMAVLRLGRDGKAVPDGAAAVHSCSVTTHGENVLAIGSTREIAERRALKKLGAAQGEGGETGDENRNPKSEIRRKSES